MAQSKSTQSGEELVKVKLFKDKGEYKDPVFVAINGNSWLIERGVEVEVPKSVKEVLDYQQYADGQVSERVKAAEE